MTEHAGVGYGALGAGLEGRGVIVTGAARGVGAATARAMAALDSGLSARIEPALARRNPMPSGVTSYSSTSPSRKLQTDEGADMDSSSSPSLP